MHAFTVPSINTTCDAWHEHVLQKATTSYIDISCEGPPQLKNKRTERPKIARTRAIGVIIVSVFRQKSHQTHHQTSKLPVIDSSSAYVLKFRSTAGQRLTLIGLDRCSNDLRQPAGRPLAYCANQHLCLLYAHGSHSDSWINSKLRRPKYVGYLES